MGLYIIYIQGVADMSLQHSWLELGAHSEGEILPGLSQQGHVGLVGAEGDEGQG